MAFTSIPFVVRTVQPVLEELGPEYEEAAETTGATRLQSFRKVVLPELSPALVQWCRAVVYPQPWRVRRSDFHRR